MLNILHFQLYRQRIQIRRDEGGFGFRRGEVFAGIKKAQDFLLGELRLGVKQFVSGGKRAVFERRKQMKSMVDEERGS
jgi:hypothetical protein